MGTNIVSNKIHICGKPGLINLLRDIKLIGFGIWQINDVGFVVKIKYVSVSDNFSVWFSTTVITSEKHIACPL